MHACVRSLTPCFTEPDGSIAVIPVHKGPREVFTVEPSDRGRVVIRTLHGYLSAQVCGVRVRHGQASMAGQTAGCLGATMPFGVPGTSPLLQPDGSIRYAQRAESNSEKFSMRVNTDGTCAFGSCHGRFLCNDGGGAVWCV